MTDGRGSGAAPTNELQRGDQVGQYEVVSLLGEGGMGTVYEAVQPLIGKRVAVKVLRPDVAAHPEMVDRFVQEARAANQARSRHIVDIFAFGQLDDGSHYFVMQYLDGVPLAEVLRRQARLPVDRGLAIVGGVCRGLQAAHGQGIVHRDLKPDNIYVLADEDDDRVRVKILDFGIAKFTDGDTRLTRAGLVMGTPAYMSPEQVTGQEVDLRTDLYALGVIMFEVFAGSVPFDGSTPMAVAHMHVNHPPPDPRQLRPDLPRGLAELMLRCVAKDRNQRPASARELWDELQGVASDELSALELAMARTTPAGMDPLETPEPPLEPARGLSRDSPRTPPTPTERVHPGSLRWLLALPVSIVLEPRRAVVGITAGAGFATREYLPDRTRQAYPLDGSFRSYELELLGRVGVGMGFEVSLKATLKGVSFVADSVVLVDDTAPPRRPRRLPRRGVQLLQPRARHGGHPPRGRPPAPGPGTVPPGLVAGAEAPHRL